MKIEIVHHQAIEARLNQILGAEEYDRLFKGMEVTGVEGDTLFLYAGEDDNQASEIEDLYALHISIIASQIFERAVSFVSVLPKEMSSFQKQ
jgi:hypothetical protein